MEDQPSPKIITLSKIISETRRVLSQQRGFLALAFLFLFPAILASLLFKDYTSSLKPHSYTLTQRDPTTVVALSLALVLFNLIFSIFAVGSITYTTLHGFNGKPVEIKSAIKSVAASFFPLLSTSLVVIFTFSAACFLYALIVFLTTIFLASLLKSLYLIVFLSTIFVVALLYVQVSWYLVYAVVVSESKWGFEAVKRSRALIEGRRMVALKLVLIFSVAGFLYYWTGSSSWSRRRSSAGDWLAFGASILCNSFLLTMCQLSGLVSNAVLYVYCNAGDEISGEYFVLPVDDEKAVSVV